jgi:hypothetical protein
MNDARRYRINAAQCLSAAEQRASPYRRLAFTVAPYWLSLERQQEDRGRPSRELQYASKHIFQEDRRHTMKAYILALTLGFALAGTGLVLVRQPPATVAACIDRGC